MLTISDHHVRTGALAVSGTRGAIDALVALLDDAGEHGAVTVTAVDAALAAIRRDGWRVHAYGSGERGADGCTACGCLRGDHEARLPCRPPGGMKVPL